MKLRRTEALKALMRRPDAEPFDIVGLAQVFGRTRRSVDRMLEQGLLPPPLDIGGVEMWTAGQIRAHIHGLMAAALSAPTTSPKP